MLTGKRITLLILTLVLILGSLTVAMGAPDDSDDDDVVELFGMAELEMMMHHAAVGTVDALEQGAELEAARNAAIEEEGENAAPTVFFEDATDGTQVAVALADYLVRAGVTELNEEPVQYQVVASSQTVRTEPNGEQAAAGAFAYGDVVTFLTVEDGWLRITNGEITGWVRPLFLAPFEGVEEEEEIEEVLPQSSNNRNVSGGGPNPGNVPDAPAVDHGQDDLYWLAVVIQYEAGSDWLTDLHQQMVANVVMNRVASNRFAQNTIHGILHAPGQYPWATRSNHPTPSARAFANAELILNGLRVIPANVVFQANFPQGSGTHAIIECPNGVLRTTYFGYL